MFSEKSVGKHAFFLLIDRIKGKEGGIHYIIYISGRRGSWGWLDLWVLQVLWVWWVLHGVVGIAGIIHRKKKLFSFFTLTPSQMWLKRPVYRGFKGEGKCEGRTFTLTPALTLPSHFRHRKVSCQGSIYRF